MIKHNITLPGTFNFEAGGSIEGLPIAFHTSPREYTPGERVIWICHGLTANSDVEDWWPQLAGPGKLFDTEKYFVICVNILGSCYGSAGPSSIDPATGKPYFFSFPLITVKDLAKSAIEVCNYLGIKKVDLLVGASIGGFQAQEMLLQAPELFERAVLIATDNRIRAFYTAMNETQRMSLDADPSFREAASLEGGKAGLEAARGLALLTYRSYDGYNLTQTDEDPEIIFTNRACTYQRYQGLKLSRRFDAYSYWYLTKCLDSHNIGRGRGGVEAALASFKVPVTVISITSDWLFPQVEMRRWAAAIPGSKYFEIESKFGHDGFLLESDQLSEIIKPLI